MKVILDASAAVSAVAGEKKLLVAEKTIGATEILAPDLFIAEVTNGLWKYVIIEGLPIDVAVNHLQSALDMINSFRPVAELAEEALRAAAIHRRVRPLLRRPRPPRSCSDPHLRQTPEAALHRDADPPRRRLTLTPTRARSRTGSNPPCSSSSSSAARARGECSPSSRSATARWRSPSPCGRG
jgi:predicted nucleic acid-binding protein